MPGQNGFDVLQVLKAQADYKMMPVIMLTDSEEEYDIVDSYQFGANAYMIKPHLLNQLKGQLEALFKFWFQTATMPKIISRTNY